MPVVQIQRHVRVAKDDRAGRSQTPHDFGIRGGPVLCQLLDAHSVGDPGDVEGVFHDDWNAVKRPQPIAAGLGLVGPARVCQRPFVEDHAAQ